MAIVLLCMIGCFRGEELVWQSTCLTIGEQVGETKSEAILLSPGVYQLRTQVDMDAEDGYLFFSVEEDVSEKEASYRALRCDGAVFFGGKGYLDFEVYVTDDVEAYIVCNTTGATAYETQDVSLYKTSLGYGILCVFVLAMSCLLNVLLWIRKEYITGRFAKENLFAICMLTASVLLSYYPYLTDYFSMGADIPYHWLRIEHLKEAFLCDQQFPVRIQPEWLYGHGYATSLFYSDLFLVFPALLRLIGFSLMSAYKIYVFAVMCGTAAIAYWSVKKCVENTYISVFAASLYVLAPYRIYNFYNRGAVGEYTAMMFYPLVLSAMYRLLFCYEKTPRQSYRHIKISLILGLSGILQCHLLSCEMLVVCVILLCLIFAKYTFRKETLEQLVYSAVSCLMMNCWFWLPMLYMMTKDTYLFNSIAEQSIQKSGTYMSGIMQIFPNMGAAQTGMYNCEPIQMGIAFLLIAVFFLVCVGYGVFVKREKMFATHVGKMYGFFCICVWVLWFASTKRFPWDLIAEIPILGVLANMLQFPTRIMALVTVFAMFMAAFGAKWLQQRYGEKIQKIVLVFLTVLGVGSAVYHVNDISYESTPIWLNNAENMGTVSVINGEYLFEGANPFDVSYGYHSPVAEEGLTYGSFEKNGLSMQIEVSNNTSEERYLELPVFGYYGYVAKDVERDDIKIALSEKKGAHGDLRIVIPGGYEGTVMIWYEGVPIFWVAELVSLIFMMSYIILLVTRRRGSECKER